MRRIVFVCLVFMLIGTVGLAAEPQEDIEITIEGKKVELDVPPRMQEGRTLVPARFMFEPLGATMEWDGENEVASGILGDQRVDMPIGSKEAKVNGEIEILDVPAQVFEGRTYIPLRFAGELSGVTSSETELQGPLQLAKQTSWSCFIQRIGGRRSANCA